MKQKPSIPQISIRWKLAAYLAIFVFVLLGVLWLCQIVFLGDVYRNIKVDQIYTAADVLRTGIEAHPSSVGSLSDSLAADSQICVTVLDAATYRQIGTRAHDTCYSIGAANTCFVHQKQGSFLSPTDLLRIQFLTTVRKSGNIFFRDMNADTQSSQGESDSSSEKPDLETAMLYVEYTEANGSGYYIVLNSKVTPVSATVQTLQYELVIISILFTVAAIIMALVLSARISAPIIKITRSAHRLATGDTDLVFEGDGYREVAELRDTLNYAAKELSRAEGFRRELIANVSHDLRTPLTMITGYAEVMRDLPGENTPENVQVIIDEGTRLTALVNDLLDVSRLQTGSIPLTRTTFSLTECITDIRSRYQKLIENDGYTIRFLADETVYVTADYPRIGQVVYNLVNNAIAYTGQDKAVTIRQAVSNTDGKRRVRISVIDTGMGISKENLEYIWDRYFKENKTHKRAVVGTGLGLSIVKGILQQHGAAFGVDTSEDPVHHGSTFWFELECSAPPSAPQDRTESYQEKESLP
ncbi:MAG: HAMP domain-containing histidine kinase [Clostridia bacterium]|nr:HAMP domain-containing histidine kinase [Clostridia bacterium]